MVIGYPLCLEGVAFRNHGIIGIYQQKEKIIVLHCAFGFGNPKQPAEDKRQPNYIMLDVFSKDFKENIPKSICVIIKRALFQHWIQNCMKKTAN